MAQHVVFVNPTATVRRIVFDDSQNRLTVYDAEGAEVAHAQPFLAGEWTPGREIQAGEVHRFTDGTVAVASTRCADTLRAAGKAAPRYCERCGLGPCTEKKADPPPPCPRCRALTTLACGADQCPNRTGGA